MFRNCVFSLLLFSWRGESTLYRVRDENNNIITFGDVIEYANQKNILETSSLTHGQLIDEKLARILVKSKLSWLNYSIDGLEKEYNKIRTPRNKKNDKSYNAFKGCYREHQNTNKSQKKNLILRHRNLERTRFFLQFGKNAKEFADFMYSNGIDWVTINEILDLD